MDELKLLRETAELCQDKLCKAIITKWADELQQRELDNGTSGEEHGRGY